MLQRSAAARRTGGDDPRAALLARIRRQPHAAALCPGLPDGWKAAIWPNGPATSSISKNGCCDTCWAAAARSIAHLTSPVVVLAHNLTPSETANLDRNFVRGFVTEVGGPGSHTAIVAEALEIPAVVGTGPFLTDVSGGDLVIIDGDQGLVILQPDEETLARYRHEAEQIRIAGRAARTAPRFAGRNRRRRAHRADGQHRVPLRSRSLRRTRGRRHRPVPHRVPLPRRPKSSRPRKSTFEAYSRVVQGDGRQAGRDPHASTWAPTSCRSMPAAEDERNPCLGLAQHPPVAAEFARCSARNCGRFCGPARWATCGSCSR